MDNLWDTLKLIGEGGLFGASGQLVQVVLALLAMRFNPGSVRWRGLIVKIAVGFAMGCVVVLFLIRSAVSEITFGNALTLLALGYAGGDFVDKLILIGKDRASLLERPSKTDPSGGSDWTVHVRK